MISHFLKRRTPLAPALALLSLTCAFAAQPAATTTPLLVLPPVASFALDHKKLSLPRDFTAPLNLLILTFARNQQSAVESWLPVTTSIPAAHPKIQTWVLPIAGRENNLYRWWLDSSMRSTLPPAQPRQFTVPLYVDKARFLRTLGIPSEKETVILLTDKAGRVLWRGAGPASDEQKASLAAFLKAQSPASWPQK